MSPRLTHIPDPETAEPLLVPGRTCWRMETAGRVGVIVDAAGYFAAAKAAMRRARHSILLTAWDFDGRVRLTPGRVHGGRPDRVARFLAWIAATRPDLEVRVLKWNTADLFDLMRRSRPMRLRRLFAHARVQYRLDDRHPTGGCHHQKILVIDDALAFCGGIDITANRWDTRAHRAGEPLRRQPDGVPYPPFHDVMMMVDGDAARALGDLARERWRRATGEELAPPPPPPASAARRLWPATVAPLFHDRPVAVARTEPAFDGRPAVREVEALHLDAIAAARRTIYLESQYFTAAGIAAALKARLAEPDGPEVVVVNPLLTPSWLENVVMTAARARLTAELRAADHHGRLRFFAPVTDGGAPIVVHAKLAIVDDRLLRIGSANLANRSMGLDTECDLAVEATPGAGDEEAVRRGIAAVRDDLVAEHLGTTAAAVAAAVERHAGSLIAAIESLTAAQGRRLVPLHDAPPSTLAATAAGSGLFDPEPAAAAGEGQDRGVPSGIPGRVALRGPLAVLVALVALVLGWRVTGLSDWTDLDRVVATAAAYAAQPWGPLLTVAVYVVGGLVMFPLLVLVAATAILYGPVPGFVIAMAGALTSGAVLFWIGRRLGRRWVERLGGPAVRRIDRAIAAHGTVAVATIRAIPVPPFTVVSLAAGVSRVGFLDYLAGTAAGLVPGTLTLALLGDRVARTLQDPGWGDVAALAGLILAAAAAGWASGRVIARLRGRAGGVAADASQGEGP